MVEASETLSQVIHSLSEKDEDPKVERLIEWVRAHGGICNVETRVNKRSGARGLYTAKEITSEDEPIVQVPNKMIISPLHVSVRPFSDQGSKTFKEIFALSPKLFDARFPFEPNELMPFKIDNALAEYFQLTFFLICERLRGAKSFFEPFLDVLPARNDTLFTLLRGSVAVKEGS